METKTLFDVAGNEIIRDKTNINSTLNIIIVGSAERPASQDDILAVLKELTQATAENRPAFFAIQCSIQSIPYYLLPKAIFQYGNDQRPARPEDIADLRKSIEIGIRENATVVAPYPLSVSYLV